jgi:hypothetical protein
MQIEKLIRKVKPIYPAAWQAQSIEGTILLAAIISKDGTPQALDPQNTVLPANPAQRPADRTPDNDNRRLHPSAAAFHGFRYRARNSSAAW